MPIMVGVGVIIVNDKNQILMGKRCGGYAPYWSIPGGRVEEGETFEQTAVRETEEETGLIVKNPRTIGVVNNLKTWLSEGIHSISLIVVADYAGGEPQRREPEKCEGWGWYSPHDMPTPTFEGSLEGVGLWLNGRFYQPN